MITFLDLLIVVALALTAVSLVTMVLMFLVKNRVVKRICLYLVAALGIYMGFVGLDILWPNFLGQAMIAGLAILTAVCAIVLERLRKNSDKALLAAEAMASAALVAGMLNVFM